MTAKIRQRIFSSRQTTSDRQKAAALLFAIGSELSAGVLKELNEVEIEMLAAEVGRIGKLSQGVTDNVLKEFHDLYEAQGFITQGSLDHAIDMLERALGKNKARKVIERLTTSPEVAPFNFLRNTDPNEIVSFLEDEHPQTIALVLAHLRPEQASIIVRQLEANLRAEVIRRIALMDRITPDIIAEVENILESKVSSLARADEYTMICGLEAVAKILNRVDRETTREILKILEGETPELANEIRWSLFTFEDIFSLDDCAIQRLLGEVDYEKLALALKAVSEDLKENIFANMSRRAGEALRERMEFLGPVRLRDVEQAQREIINVVHCLEEDGEIIITRGGEEGSVV
ncbi:MAG: flagellar motor switch protein FliG [Actinobacteria bacterium]|nr:flagellar motor switch protein FliG [Actinomycetota bacterium]